MAMYSKWVNGNLVYYDNQRWLDAVGPGVVKFLDEFVNTPFEGTDAPGAYTTTLVEAGASETTVALTEGEGGYLLITTDANENDGANIQVKGEAFKLSGSKPLYFGCRFKVNEATQSDFLVGLAVTDTDLLGGVTDGVYFRKVDGSTTMAFVLEKDSTETSTNYGTAVAADTFTVVELFYDGSNVDWYVDGVLQTRPATTNLPNDEFLTPSIQYLSGAAGAKTMTIDWIRAIQIV